MISPHLHVALLDGVYGATRAATSSFGRSRDFRPLIWPMRCRSPAPASSPSRASRCRPYRRRCGRPPLRRRPRGALASGRPGRGRHRLRSRARRLRAPPLRTRLQPERGVSFRIPPPARIAAGAGWRPANPSALPCPPLPPSIPAQEVHMEEGRAIGRERLVTAVSRGLGPGLFRRRSTQAWKPLKLPTRPTIQSSYAA